MKLQFSLREAFLIMVAASSLSAFIANNYWMEQQVKRARTEGCDTHQVQMSVLRQDYENMLIEKDKEIDQLKLSAKYVLFWDKGCQVKNCLKYVSSTNAGVEPNGMVTLMMENGDIYEKRR